MDRPGSAIQDMLTAHAIAFAVGGVYAGACIHPVLKNISPKYQAMQFQLITDLGLQHVIPYACPDDNVTLIQAFRDYVSSNETITEALTRKARNTSETSTTAAMTNTSRFVLLHSKDYAFNVDTSLFTTEWLQLVHSQIRMSKNNDNKTHPPLITNSTTTSSLNKETERAVPESKLNVAVHIRREDIIWKS
jgi:hypothetical protein